VFRLQLQANVDALRTSDAGMRDEQQHDGGQPPARTTYPMHQVFTR